MIFRQPQVSCLKPPVLLGYHKQLKACLQHEFALLQDVIYPKTIFDYHRLQYPK
jgi:hypothetical protein